MTVVALIAVLTTTALTRLVVASPEAAAAPAPAWDTGNPGVATDWRFGVPDGQPPIGPDGLKRMIFQTTIEAEPSMATNPHQYMEQIGFQKLNEGRAPIVVEANVTSVGVGRTTTSALHTKSSGSLVLAFVRTRAGGTVTVSNPPTISAFQRVSTTATANGEVQVWWAHARPGTKLTGETVTAATTTTGAPITLTVQASNGGWGIDYSQPGWPRIFPHKIEVREGVGTAPNVALPDLTPGSSVIGIGLAASGSANVTVGAGQELAGPPVKATDGSTSWIQRMTTPASGGSTASLGAALSASAPWTFVGVEVQAQYPGFYLGLQRDSVRFSSFGGMIEPATPADWAPYTNAGRCDQTPDGWVGVGCWIGGEADAVKYPTTIGHTYQLEVNVSPYGPDPTRLLYRGSARDLTTGGPERTIGLWTVPATWGMLPPGGGSIFERYTDAKADCNDLPYVRVRRARPLGVTADNRLVGASVDPVYRPHSYAGCDGAVSIAYGVEGVVQTVGRPRGAAPLGTTTISGRGTLKIKPFSVVSYARTPGAAPEGHLYLAFVTTANSQTVGTLTSTDSRAGQRLTWTRVTQQRDTGRAGGNVEIWQARSTTPITDLVVEAPVSGVADSSGTLTVQAYINAAAVGAKKGASGTGGAANVSLTPGATGAHVVAAGINIASLTKPVVPAGQTLDTSFSDGTKGATTWLQHRDATTTYGAAAPSSVTSPTTGAWTMATVEVLPAPFRIMADGPTRASTGTKSVTVSVTPTYPGEQLVALVATSNHLNQSATVTGGGLTWTRVQQFSDGQPVGARLELWTARAGAALTPITVTSTLAATSDFRQTLFVQAFSGVESVIARGTRWAATGAPTMSITPGTTGSWLGAVGYDVDNATPHVAGPNQTMDAQASDTVVLTQMWTQHHDVAATAGVARTVNDSAPTGEHFALLGFELVPKA